VSAATVRRLPRAAVPPQRDTAGRAALLYPDSTYLQAEWQRAVAVVRATSGGWLLDKPQRRAGHA